MNRSMKHGSIKEKPHLCSSHIGNLQRCILGWKLYGILNFKVCQGYMVYTWLNLNYLPYTIFPKNLISSSLIFIVHDYSFVSQRISSNCVLKKD